MKNNLLINKLFRSADKIIIVLDTILCVRFLILVNKYKSVIEKESHNTQMQRFVNIELI